jgi:ribosomal protein S18 acetylase RimI-like enzyme
MVYADALSTPIIIERAITKDIDVLTELFELYRSFYGKEPQAEKARAFLLERMAKEESVIYLARNTQPASPEEQGMMRYAGFVQLYPVFSSTRMQRLWLLNDLYVRSEYRGRGISKRLIEEAKQLAHTTQACGLLLETAKNNHIGNALYPREGFTLTDTVNFYWWDAIERA